EPRRALAPGPTRSRPRLAAAGGDAVVANPVQADGDVRDQDQVVVAEDDLDLGAGQVQAQRPAGLGGDGDGPVAGLDRDEPQASFHSGRIHKSSDPGNMDSWKLVSQDKMPRAGGPPPRSRSPAARRTHTAHARRGDE